MDKVITIPKEIAKDDLIITGRESFERLSKVYDLQIYYNY